MDIFFIVAIIFAVISAGGILWYLFIFNRNYQQSSNMRNLMTAGTGQEVFMPRKEAPAKKRDKSLEPSNDSSISELDQDLKARTERIRKKSRKRTITLEEKFYHAGLFSPDERANFKKKRIIYAIVVPLIFMILSYHYQISGNMLLLMGVMGVIIGLQIPFSMLDRKIAVRNEDIMFYLPLVVEQISIGVSSSLDIGPCLDKVVSMAEERDSHNVVTELVKQVHFYVKSGVSLNEALTEIGRLSGHNELKHVFTSLSQVAKHGGEITKQLQELADAVSSQRETKIEEKIKKLELEATGPVALVFVGFMAILLIGFGLQIQGAF